MRRSPLRADIVVWFEWVDRARLQHTPNSVQFFSSAPSCVMTMDVDRAGQIEEFFGGVENPDVSMTGESINQKRQADRSSLPSKATKLPPAANSSQPKGKGKGQRRQVQQSDQSTEELKQTIKLMARAMVRHEDAIQTLRLDTGLVWFAQVGDGTSDTISIIPFLRGVAQKWHGKENPEMSSRPLREGQDQDSGATSNPGHIVEKHASDGGRGSSASSVLLHSQTGSIRDRSCSIRAGSVIRDPNGTQVFQGLLDFQGNTAWQLIGVQYRRENLQRAPVVQEILKRLDDM